MNYPQYRFNSEDADKKLARFVHLDNPESYPFDEYHSHEYNEMLVFIAGGGVHNIDFKEFRIEDRSIHLLASGSLHWVERGMDSKGFAIVYKERFLYKLQEFNPDVNFVSFFESSRVLDLSSRQFAEFENLISEMLYSEKENDYLLNLIGAFFTRLVIRFQEQNVYKRDVPDEIIINLIGLINRHFKERLTTQQYAEKLCISPSALEKRVKRKTNATIHMLQQERILKEAKMLLNNPDISIKEIAWTLGFQEPAHFSNWFKKHTQLSPSVFSKKN